MSRNKILCGRGNVGRLCQMGLTSTATTTATANVNVNLNSNSNSNANDGIKNNSFRSHACRRTFISASNIVQEKVIMKVPTMGDSITEGTIVEWQAQIGQKVRQEDVIALIETDKVTVDIKATTTGVLTKQFGEIDDNVDVGADLCEIDTDAVATVEAASTDDPTEETTIKTPETSSSSHSTSETTTTPEPITSSSSSSSPRIPLIKFLGKDGWAAALTVEPEVQIPADYGRPPFTDVEMEALITGGANLAPELKAYSTKALYF